MLSVASMRDEENQLKEFICVAQDISALKQAEEWMKIAEQNKPTDAAASDAAEWAIQRSLTQLKEAEKGKRRERR